MYLPCLFACATVTTFNRVALITNLLSDVNSFSYCSSFDWLTELVISGVGCLLSSVS